MWEYLIDKIEVSIYGDFETPLNELGEDGWELVDVLNTETDSVGYDNEIVYIYECVFKRLKRA